MRRRPSIRTNPMPNHNVPPIPSLYMITTSKGEPNYILELIQPIHLKPYNLVLTIDIWSSCSDEDEAPVDISFSSSDEGEALVMRETSQLRISN